MCIRDRYKENTIQKKSAQQVLVKIRNALRFLIRVRGKGRMKTLCRALHKWKRSVSALQLHGRKKKLEKNLEDKYRNQILQKNQEAEALEETLKNEAKELAIIKNCGEQLKQAIKEREAKRLALAKSLDKAKQNELEDSKESLSSEKGEDAASKLEARIRVLEKENTKLKEQISHTEGNVSDFASEMNKYLDSIEFLRTVQCNRSARYRNGGKQRARLRRTRGR
eukprot:TRINITY_DN12526_c0_g1_i10.p1 TRINITY_DN12526_c0_g1~~TRINITY_DN12526_c0_g1_i10.p1  ORF type:complete len:224 (-),score=67.34 TRINITY_DN12526_c0_g1_i10:109-780(-)